MCLKNTRPDADGVIRIGYGMLARRTNMAKGTACRTARTLVRKHSIRLLRDPKPEGKRTSGFTHGYVLPSPQEVRRAREADPSIGNDGQGYGWIGNRKQFVSRSEVLHRGLSLQSPAGDLVANELDDDEAKDVHGFESVLTEGDRAVLAYDWCAHEALEEGRVRDAARYVRRAMSADIDDTHIRILVSRLVQIAAAHTGKDDRDILREFLLRRRTESKLD